MTKIYLERIEVQMQGRLTREVAPAPQNEISWAEKTWCNHMKYPWNKPALWGSIKHTTHTWLSRFQCLPLHYSCLGSPAQHPLTEQVFLSSVELVLEGADSSWIFKQEKSSTLVRAARFADPKLFICRENGSVTTLCGAWNTDVPIGGLWNPLTWTYVYICTYTYRHQLLLLGILLGAFQRIA